MVHRPVDSRLLSNLLQQEKEYSKQLAQVIESSNASLALFAAYAAASAPPTSHVIMAVAGSLAAADEAFRRYVAGVDEWREAMRSLKDAEEEVGNIMRDREILVTRLIKASKSPKNGSGSIRDSLLLGMQHFPSSSSLALSVGNTDSPSPAPSRPLSSPFSSSTKLAAAQSELQACEAHLAVKERELAEKRNAAIKDGLGARIRAMMDCGWQWHELGKGALQSLDELKPEQRLPQRDIHSDTLRVPETESARPSSDFSSIGPSQSASQIDDLPPPISMAAVMTSGAFDDLPSGKPMNTAQTDTNALRPSSHMSSGSSIFSSNPAVPTTYQVETVKYAPAIAVHVLGSSKDVDSTPTEEPKSDYTSIPIPAPHALEGYVYDIPTAAATAPRPVAGPSGLQRPHLMSDSGYSSPQRSITPQPRSYNSPQLLTTAFHPGHVLERRISEDSQEDRRRNSAGVIQDEEDTSSYDELNEEDKLVQEGKLAVVENPRYMSEARRREIEKEKERAARKEEEERRRMENGTQRETDATPEQRDKEPGKEKKRFLLFHHHAKAEKTLPETRTVTFASLAHDERVSPSKLGFLGSLRGLFTSKPLVSTSSAHGSPSPGRSATRTSHTGRDGDDEYIESDAEPSPTKTSSRGFQNIFRQSEKSKAARRPSSARWETRTDKNIKRLAKQASFDDGTMSVPGRVGVGLAANAVAKAGVVNATGVGLAKGSRGRTVSDSGAISRGASRDEGEVAGPSSTGKRLKKASRAGLPVSSSATGVSPGATAPGLVASNSASAIPRKGTGRRSASVDDRAEASWRKSYVDETEGEGMIVDLGWRKRTVSEAGTPPAESTKRKGATVGTASKPAIVPQPAAAPTSTSTPTRQDVFGPTKATKGYSSDTAATKADSSGPVKKKSLTKKRELGVAPGPAATSTAAPVLSPAPVVVSPRPPQPATASTIVAPAPTIATPTPTRRSSIKSTTPSSKSPLSQQLGPATVLAAGGEHPSGVLVQQPGWDAQALAQGGTLSRNNSTTSAASAPAIGGAAATRGGGRKKSTLGQGMGGSGGVARRASLSGASTSKMEVPSRAANVHGNAKAASVIQPLPPALNLMSIIEDVARTNREGWAPDSKRKSVGGSQKPSGMLDVKAPPLMERAKLEAMDAAEMRHWAAGSSSLSTSLPTTSPTMVSRTGMFEIKAPGSVFDQRPAKVARPSAAVQRSTVGQSIRQGQPPAAEAHTGTSSAQFGTTSANQAAYLKVPLRSALRNSSRSPSPATRPPRHAGQSSQPLQVEEQPLPPPVEGGLPWGSDGALHQPRKVDKSKAPAPPADSEISEQSGDESNEVFYSDLEDTEGGAIVPASGPAATSQVLPTSETAAGTTTSGMNGHAIGHAKTTSEVSQSSTSTFVPTGSSSAQPPQEQQGPRRRKSVRVSLQPTFSPSPPAIEYDDEEQQRLRAPWVWQTETSGSRPHSYHAMAPSLPAPIPLRAPVKTVATEEPDIWADSSDEDEQYARAKRLLTRAAKKDRDAKVLAANSAH